MGFRTPDKNLTIHSVDEGYLFYSIAGDIDTTVRDTLIQRKVVIDQMEKLVQLYKADQPIYARINSGARAGSIARIARSSISLVKVPSGDPSGYRQIIKEGTLQTDPRIRIKVMKDGHSIDNIFFGSDHTYLWIGLNEYLKFARGQDHHYSGGILIYEFDGRKPVKTSFTDQSGLELLPDYQGPTVFEFARKDPVSAAEKARLAKENALAFTPIDRFGHELQVGDMFIYGKANDLIFGKLIKVSEKGIITCRDFMSNKETRLMAEDTVRCLKHGLRISALMRFDKDEVLSQKLMVEKLKR